MDGKDTNGGNALADKQRPSITFTVKCIEIKDFTIDNNITPLPTQKKVSGINFWEKWSGLIEL